MTDAPKITRLQDYIPSAFLVQTVDLTFDLFDEETIVVARMNLTNNPAVNKSQTLSLHGDALTLLDIQLNGEPLADARYTCTPDALIIRDCPQGPFELVITTRIDPQNNTQLSGLYRSNQLYCTQCEAHGFRRITYYLDRPDVMATFTTTIHANKKAFPILLSNGNLIERHDHGDRHGVTWQDPFPKPCYLFALVAGDLDCLVDEFITRSGKSVCLEIYVEKGKVPKAHHAMASLKKAMRWDEDVYNLEYDLSIFMIVAVSDFNMGAMENKGLNIFNDQYILADPQTATDADYLNIESVVAHEYFHNWTGNRVTCRDWFQLSLKEGLTVFRDQSFSCDMNSHDVIRINEVNILRSMQFAEDAGPMAHPVRPHSYMEINNFYTATVYNKGAEVIRMMHLLLGEAGFAAGMKLYFQRHDGQAVTTEDFAQAMMDANGVDFTQFKFWYDYAGTPTVKVISHYDAKTETLSLTFTQSVPDTPGQKNKPAFHIPIALGIIDSDGHECALRDDLGKTIPSVISLKEKQQTVNFYHVKPGSVPSLLRGFSAPVILTADRSDDELAHLFAYDTDGFARYEAGQQLLSNTILRAYHAGVDVPVKVSDTLAEAYETLLKANIDDTALFAQLITLPSLAYLKSFVKEVDIAALHHARKQVHAQLVIPNLKTFENLYARYRNQTDDLSQASMGARKLQNTGLLAMTQFGDASHQACAYEQFSNDTTMTNIIAGLAALNDIDCTQRAHALAAFYEMFKSNELVVNKWFTMQAMSELPGTLSTVKQLLTHPSFTYKNPNRARALIHAFCSANLLRFHASDGEGYQFLVEQIAIVDPMNAQLAARLASPLTQWASVNPAQQALMLAALKQIEALPNLSMDVYEIVQKSLDANA